VNSAWVGLYNKCGPVHLLNWSLSAEICPIPAIPLRAFIVISNLWIPRGSAELGVKWTIVIVPTRELRHRAWTVSQVHPNHGLSMALLDSAGALMPCHCWLGRAILMCYIWQGTEMWLTTVYRFAQCRVGTIIKIGRLNETHLASIHIIAKELYSLAYLGNNYMFRPCF
jgi:hypothetical protein